MGRRDRSTLRESRVVSASSTHFCHHALGIGIGASIVERSYCLTQTKEENKVLVCWLVGLAFGCYIDIDIDFVSSSYDVEHGWSF